MQTAGALAHPQHEHPPERWRGGRCWRRWKRGGRPQHGGRRHQISVRRETSVPVAAPPCCRPSACTTTVLTCCGAPQSRRPRPVRGTAAVPQEVMAQGSLGMGTAATGGSDARRRGRRSQRPESVELRWRHRAGGQLHTAHLGTVAQGEPPVRWPFTLSTAATWGWSARRGASRHCLVMVSGSEAAARKQTASRGPACVPVPSYGVAAVTGVGEHHPPHVAV